MTWAKNIELADPNTFGEFSQVEKKGNTSCQKKLAK